MITHIKGLLFQNDFIMVTDENNSVNIRPKNINKSFFISEILKQEYINNDYLNYLKNNFDIKSKNINLFSYYWEKN